MLLHNETVNVGDRVYDISYNRGYGTVFLIRDNKIHVRFPRSNVTFSENGIQSGGVRQTLFWDVPVIFAPSKDDANWIARKDFHEQMFALLDQYKTVISPYNKVN